jgi:hypothetical protein
MILTTDQRQARGLSGHFGDRSLQGLYLGCQVDGSSGFFKHLFTDGHNIFATPHEMKVVPDVYPLRVQNPRKGPIPSIDDVDMQLLGDEGGVTLAVFTAWVMESRADKEREIQLYLEYRRDCEMSEVVQAMGQDVVISLPSIKVRSERLWVIYPVGMSTASMDFDVASVEGEAHLQAYMQVQQVPNDTGSLMWWKQHQQKFPDLSRMTRQYLAVPATSVSPERFLSRVGLLQTDLCGNLLDATMIDLMWAKQAP